MEPIAKNVCLGLAVVCIALATVFALRAALGRPHLSRPRQRAERWCITAGLVLACIGFYGEAAIRSLID